VIELVQRQAVPSNFPGSLESIKGQANCVAKDRGCLRMCYSHRK
jgi:hypothetical protein